METRKLKTPGNHDVEIKEFFSKKDQRQIMAVMNDVEITMNEEGKASPKMKFEKASEMEDKTIEVMVVSVDGKKENVLENVLNLDIKDYDFILKEINEVQTGIKKKS